MKSFNDKIRVALCLFLQFIVASAFAGHHNAKDTTATTKCLEIVGIALDQKDQPINGVTVRLFKENSELEWTEITCVTYHEHSFLFSLDANEYYTIEVSKPGFVTRSIGVSTKLPEKISMKEMFKYEFEVSLFKEKKGVDDYYLDFPVALISYDPKHDVFDNNNAYTKHIKTKIKESTNEASGMKTVANTKKTE